MCEKLWTLSTDGLIEIFRTVAEDFPVVDILLSGKDGKACLFLPGCVSGHVIEMQVCTEECTESGHSLPWRRHIVRRIHKNGVRVLPHEVGVGVQNAVNKRIIAISIPALMPGRLTRKQVIQWRNRQWTNRRSAPKGDPNPRPFLRVPEAPHLSSPRWQQLSPGRRCIPKNFRQAPSDERLERNAGFPGVGKKEREKKRTPESRLPPGDWAKRPAR